MKSSKIIFAFIFLFFPVSLLLCQVLQIEEFDRQGKKNTVDFRKISFPIVDINSTLHIQIDKDVVRAKAVGLKLYDQSYDSEKLITIIKILKKENELLEIIGSTTGTPEHREKKLDKFSTSMSTLTSFIMDIKSMRIRANEIYNADYDANKTYSLLIALVRDEIKDIGKEIDKAIKDQRIYFRLGGWLRNEYGNLQPIHVPQFDTYEEGKFFEVPRFIMPAPEELRRQYKEASDAAEEYNKKGVTAFDEIRMQIRTFNDSLNSALLCVDTNYKNSIDLLKDIEKIKNQVKPFMDQLDFLIKDVKNVAQIIQKVNESSDPLGMGTSYIGQLLDLFKNIEIKTPELVKLFDSTTRQLRERVSAEAKEKIENFLSVSSKCLEPLKTYKDKVKVLANEIQNWLVLSVPDHIAVNLEFTDKVNSFLIEDIPESTDLDLRSTGQRSDGDEIYFKAALEKRSDLSANQDKLYELERKSLTMFRVNWYTELSAGVVFLDPVKNSATKLTKQFQAAPSYSLLFKWGSRESYAHNKFWRLGIGVNIAAPDFDLDSTPEIGLGVTMTTALDYLQIGFGRNLGVETWYWFFGLRLPIGTVTITGDENKSVK